MESIKILQGQSILHKYTIKIHKIRIQKYY